MTSRSSARIDSGAVEMMLRIWLSARAHALRAEDGATPYTQTVVGSGAGALSVEAAPYSGIVALRYARPT